MVQLGKLHEVFRRLKMITVVFIETINKKAKPDIETLGSNTDHIFESSLQLIK